MPFTLQTRYQSSHFHVMCLPLHPWTHIHTHMSHSTIYPSPALPACILSYKLVVHNCFRLYRPKQNVLVISASSLSFVTSPLIPLWHSFFSDQQRTWVETQYSQLWEAGFQILLASAFWIFVEWSGFNALLYIGLSFLESDSWGKSLVHELFLPHYLPTAIIAFFTLIPSTLPPALGSSTAPPSAHVTPTLWPP